MADPKTERVAVTTLDDLRAGDVVAEAANAFQVPIVDRAVPQIKPGTAGTATVRGVADVRVMRVEPSSHNTHGWVSPRVPTPDGLGFNWLHSDDQVTDFVPDDADRWRRQVLAIEHDRDEARAEAEGLRWEVEKYKQAARKYQDEHAKECAEVDRLRATLAEANDRLTDLEKDRATVERVEELAQEWRDADGPFLITLQDLRRVIDGPARLDLNAAPEVDQ